jgi:hypothetical protein
VRVLQDHSFEILSTVYITAPMDVVSNPRLKKILRGTLFGRDTTRVPFLATAILLHAKKINPTLSST